MAFCRCAVWFTIQKADLGRSNQRVFVTRKKVAILGSEVIQNGSNHLFCPFCQGISKSQTSCNKKTTISIEVVLSQLIEADGRKLLSLLGGVK